MSRCSSFRIVFRAAALAAAVAAVSCGGRSGGPESQPMGASASATVTTDEPTPSPAPATSAPAPATAAQPAPSPSGGETAPAGVAVAAPSSAAADTPAWVIGDAGPMQVSFRLSLYQKEGKSGAVPVQASQVFTKGDSIRVGATATENGYIYLLHRGSTGRFKILYPDGRLGGGGNAVPKGREVVIPARAWFTFDKHPGIETIYALYSTQRGAAALRALQDAVGRAPASPAAPDEEKTLTDAVNKAGGKDAAEVRSLVRVVRLTHQ